MAVFTAAQPLADTFCWWLPLYYEAKLGLAVYLWANGGCRAEGGGARGCHADATAAAATRVVTAGGAHTLTHTPCLCPPSCN